MLSKKVGDPRYAINADTFKNASASAGYQNREGKREREKGDEENWAELGLLPLLSFPSRPSHSSNSFDSHVCLAHVDALCVVREDR